MSTLISICLVDDDEIYQFTMKKALKSLESISKIMVFNDGAEALDFMLDNLNTENELPDVIFLDINMPIMDGFQFMEEFVRLKPKVGKKITVFMVSSSVDPVDIERAKDIGEVSDYIIKPIRVDMLESIIANLKESGKI